MKWFQVSVIKHCCIKLSFPPKLHDFPKNIFIDFHQTLLFNFYRGFAYTFSIPKLFVYADYIVKLRFYIFLSVSVTT